MGGEFWFDRAGVMEMVEDGFNVSLHRYFAGSPDVVPFEVYYEKKFTSPILMHSFIIFEQDV